MADSLRHILRSLEAHAAGARGPAFSFIVSAPDHYGAQEVLQFRAWLEQAGFTEALVGDKIMMRLADNKLEELRRVVNSEVSLRGSSPRLGSPEYKNAGKSPSPPAKVRSVSDSAMSREIDWEKSNIVPISAAPLTRTRSQTAHQLTIDARGASGMSTSIEGLESVRQKNNFAPRKGMLSVGDRAESPAGLSPFSSSPRFFVDDQTSGRNTPTGFGSSSGDNDEVYPQLGAGMGALKLNRGISSDSVSTSLPPVHETDAREGPEEKAHFLEDELRDGVVVHGNSKGDDEREEGEVPDEEDKMSDTSTVLDDSEEEDPFDPDADLRGAAALKAAPVPDVNSLLPGQARQAFSAPKPTRATRSQVLISNSGVNTAQAMAAPQCADPSLSIRRTRSQCLRKPHLQELEDLHSINTVEEARKEVAMDTVRTRGKSMGSEETIDSHEHSGEGLEELHMNQLYDGVATYGAQAMTRDRSPSLTSLEQTQGTSRSSNSPLPLGRDSNGNLRAVDRPSDGDSRSSDGAKSPPLPGFPDWTNAGSAHRERGDSMGSLSNGRTGGGSLDTTGAQARQERRKIMRAGLVGGGGAAMPMSGKATKTLHPGQQTPKTGGSIGSSDRAKFNTPQGEAGPVLSGRGDIDWGVSEAAPKSVLDRLRTRAHEIRQQYNLGRPSLLRAHSANDIDGHTVSRNVPQGIPSNFGSGSAFASRTITHAGPFQDNSNVANIGSGARDGQDRRGNGTEKLLVSPVFGGSSDASLLRSTSHAPNLERGAFSPESSSSLQEGQGQCTSPGSGSGCGGVVAADGNSTTLGSGGGIAMTLADAGSSIFGDSPGGGGFSAKFGATFPPSVYRGSTTSDNMQGAVQGHPPAGPPVHNSQVAPMGGGAFRPPDIGAAMGHGNAPIPSAPPQWVQQKRHQYGEDLALSEQDEEPMWQSNPVAHARSVYQKSQLEGFRSIVTDAEFSLPADASVASYHEGESGVDVPLETEGFFFERLQRVSPGARKDRRVRMSAAKWRRQSVGFRPQLGRGGDLGVLKSRTMALLTEGHLSGLATGEEDGQEIDQDSECNAESSSIALHEKGLDTSMSPSVMCKGKVSTTKKKRPTDNWRGRVTIQGVLPISPATSGDGTDSVSNMETQDIATTDSDSGALVSDAAGDPYAAAVPVSDLKHAASSESFTLGSGRDLGDIDNHMHPDLPGLHARSFRGVVVGGIYQQCFDGPTPVVAPPLASATRVTGVLITSHDSLELRLNCPSQSDIKTVDLGQAWRWMRTSPEGYLVFQQEISLPMPRGCRGGDGTSVCYYLPRHPFDWAEDCEENSAYNQHVLQAQDRSGYSHSANSPHSIDHSFTSNSSVNSSAHKHPHSSRGETPIMDSAGATPNVENLTFGEYVCHGDDSRTHERGERIRPQVSWADSGLATNVRNTGGVLDAMLANATMHSPRAVGGPGGEVPLSSMDTPGHHYDQQDYYRNLHGISGEGHVSMDESIDHSDYAAELDVKMVLYTDSANWNNAGIVSYVLQFLLGDDGQVVGDTSDAVGRRNTSSECTTHRTRRNTRRTRNMESAREDATSYRLVSKSWALGSFRLLARHLSHAENSPALPWSRWAKFVSRYSWGRFLASGACKNVYCVQNTHNSGLLEAVSVMDVHDLEARDMGDAVTKEIEISLACSSLSNLHVCPNLLQVYSLFRSDCPVPSTLWNSQQLAPPPQPIAIGSGSSSGNSSGNSSSSGACADRTLTRGASVTVPKKQTLELGSYQYIRMEYCSGGDLEDFVRDHRVLPIESVRPMLFQMCFSLYCCRDQLALRHFDIKLLNFMVAQGSTLLPPELAACGVRRANSPFESMRSMMDRGNVVEMRIGIGHQIYCLPMLTAGKELVKLADFGTSVMGEGGLGDPITVQQFTTLENVPPEFLLMGSFARQGFSADTFPLGLCYLHLLTGYEPYEILLQDVFCPPYLISRLQELWSPEDIEDQYYVVKEAVQSTVVEEESSTEVHNAGYEGALLAHTLYRYLILFGALHGDDVDISSPVWTTVQQSLRGDDSFSSSSSGVKLPSSQGTSRRIQRRYHGDGRREAQSTDDARDECRRRYARDRAVWSVHEGHHPVMRSVRDRLHSMGKGALKMLERMVHFDPSRRCTMFEALISPLFAPLLDTSLTPEQVALLSSRRGLPSSPISRPRSASPRSFLQRSPSGALQHGVAFMHYYRSPEDGGIENIPVV